MHHAHCLLLAQIKYSGKITMMKLTCILIALAIVRTCAEESKKKVDGIPINFEEYPHVMSIRMKGIHICSGSLIGVGDAVLTTAHCLAPLIQDPKLTSHVSIITGTNLLNQTRQSFQIKKLYVHENYNIHAQDRTTGYDIGLILLNKMVVPIKNKIELPTSDVRPAEDVTIVGWGFNKQNNLQKLNAKCMPAPTCQQYHQGFMNIHQMEFCTLTNYGTGICNSDSGSSVIRNTDKTIIGILSGGKPCVDGYPDIYTDVYPFYNWIRKYMYGNN